MDDMDLCYTAFILDPAGERGLDLFVSPDAYVYQACILCCKISVWDYHGIHTEALPHPARRREIGIEGSESNQFNKYEALKSLQYNTALIFSSRSGRRCEQVDDVHILGIEI